MNFQPNEFLQKLAQQISQVNTPSIDCPGFRDAAVIAPLLQTEKGWELLFTVRSKQLNNHPGQISFPGGKVESGETLVQAAARELHEELGISPHQLLGQLDTLLSPAEFVVYPFVAQVAWPQPLTIDSNEVEEVFTVPLDELANVNPRTEQRNIRGSIRNIYYYEIHNRVIWGLTGNIVRQLLMLRANCLPNC